MVNSIEFWLARNIADALFWLAVVATLVLLVVIAWVLAEMCATLSGAWRRWRAEVDDPFDVETRWPNDWVHTCYKFPGQGGMPISLSVPQGECCPNCGRHDESLPAPPGAITGKVWCLCSPGDQCNADGNGCVRNKAALKPVDRHEHRIT